MRYCCVANFKLMIIQHTEESRHRYCLYMHTNGENITITESSILNLKCIFWDLNATNEDF